MQFSLLATLVFVTVQAIATEGSVDPATQQNDNVTMPDYGEDVPEPIPNSDPMPEPDSMPSTDSVPKPDSRDNVRDVVRKELRSLFQGMIQTIEERVNSQYPVSGVEGGDAGAIKGEKVKKHRKNRPKNRTRKPNQTKTKARGPVGKAKTRQVTVTEKIGKEVKTKSVVRKSPKTKTVYVTTTRRVSGISNQAEEGGAIEGTGSVPTPPPINPQDYEETDDLDCEEF